MKTFNKSLIPLIIIVVAINFSALAQTWTENTPIPTKRWCPVSVTIGDNIYVIGGQDDGGVSIGTLEIYYPATDSWETKSSMNEDRWAPMATVVDGKIYVIGGMQGTISGNNYDAVNYVEEYNPVTDIWTIKTPMPTARGWGGCGTISGLDNKIYVIGGFAMTGYLSYDTVEVYTVETDSWSVGLSMPFERDCFMTTQIGDNIYIMGGYAGPTLTGSVLEFNPVLGTYIELEGLPIARAFGAATNNNEMVYVVGGREGNSAAFHEYNPLTNTWGNLIDMPIARDGLTTSIINDTLFAISGAEPYMGGSLFDVNESIDYQTTTSIENNSVDHGCKFFNINPNPAKMKTRISIYIPENVRQASIIVQDIRGIVYKELQILERGDCSFTIEGLSKGINFCSLIINGKKVHTERLIVVD